MPLKEKEKKVSTRDNQLYNVIINRFAIYINSISRDIEYLLIIFASFSINYSLDIVSGFFYTKKKELYSPCESQQL